jgi:hypothetical protein
MFPDLHKKTEAELIDMLAIYTAKYAEMVLNRDLTSDEFYDCKMIVRYLQSEIEARKHPDKDSGLYLQK